MYCAVHDTVDGTQPTSNERKHLLGLNLADSSSEGALPYYIPRRRSSVVYVVCLKRLCIAGAIIPLWASDRTFRATFGSGPASHWVTQSPLWYLITRYQYEATIDRNANAKDKSSEMILKTFFGELQRIVKIDVPAT